MPISASTRSIWSACRWGGGASATRFSVASSAEPEGALPERTVVVRPAHTLVADTIALFNGSTAREVRAQQARADLHPDGRHRRQADDHAPGEEMRLHQTRLPGDALAPFTKLKHLDLSHNIFFDDRGLRHTAKMPGLTKLYLEDTSVTDQGLKNLSGLVQMTELNLNGTKTTDSGLAALVGIDESSPARARRDRNHRWRHRVADAHDAVRRRSRSIGPASRMPGSRNSRRSRI